jgi:hypothetical protein
MSSARRIWHSSVDGRKGGELLKYMDLQLLERLADFLEVEPGDLIERTREG